ncbi:hypothetical protein GCM10010431_78290 [Streptomyces kunmingensis]
MVGGLRDGRTGQCRADVPGRLCVTKVSVAERHSGGKVVEAPEGDPGPRREAGPRRPGDHAQAHEPSE